MLTRELAISRIVQGEIQPDRLTRTTHSEYLALAPKLLSVYETGSGVSRRSLHARIRDLLMQAPNCPPKRIGAFCKLLDERSEFETDARGESAKLRQKVFRLAAEYHPITEELSPKSNSLGGTLASTAKERIAESLQLTWREIESKLFLDLPENHLLKAFRTYEDPSGLLAKYNVAQTQAILYDALGLTVYANDSLKEILRYAKLARLMHRIERQGDQYRIHFDGPASLLQRTTRYGVAMAKFLPGLLACHAWHAEAWIQKPKWGKLLWRIDSHCKLKSDTEPTNEFDSRLEERFFRDWARSETNGWSLKRESQVLHRGQHVFVPDFEVIHTSGERVHLEIVGFWTPEYLVHKQKMIDLFPDQRIVLLVQSSIASKLEPAPKHHVLEFKSKIQMSKVMGVLESLRRCGSTPDG
ncbi:MAG: DUF790 family protein [Pirellula sp.]|nr:DUF790 family protein [Pirellula sp.]